MPKAVTKYCALIASLVVVLAGCGLNKKRLNERVTLWRNDKIPYGTFYSYTNLSRIFPGAEVKTVKASPDRFKGLNFREPADELVSDDKKSVHIIISPQVQPDEGEIRALFNYVAAGNHIFISSFSISKNLLDSLHLAVSLYSGRFNISDSLIVSVDHPTLHQSKSFTYPGKAFDNKFKSVDTSITNILGTDAEGNINYVKIAYESGGSVSVHLAPMSFTNFFLLHKNNKAYYDNVLSHLPQDVDVVKWDDYFRNPKSSKRQGFSKLAPFLDNEILRWAFWLTVILFAIIYLFESKRKQNVVPVIPPVRNASLDFVKTVGRLYFQRKDNKNLALKMSAHFLDHVRTRYNIPTSVLDEEFENKLAYKSDFDRTAIRDIVYSVKTLPDQLSLTDEELLTFNEKLEKFIKHH